MDVTKLLCAHDNYRDAVSFVIACICHRYTYGRIVILNQEFKDWRRHTITVLLIGESVFAGIEVQ